MSQFGYAEEQGENKARADIHVLFLHLWFLLVVPTIVNVCYCVLCKGTGIVAHVLSTLLFSYLHENNPEERRRKKWGW